MARPAVITTSPTFTSSVWRIQSIPRISPISADDPRGARALNERGHGGPRVGHEKDLAVVVADLAHSADDAAVGDDDVVEEHAVLRTGAEDDRVEHAGRVSRDDRSAPRFELQRLRSRG